MTIQDVLKQNEYSFMKEDKRLGDNLAFVCFGGSHAYGTNVQGSDIDIRGIAMNNVKDTLLHHSFEQIVDSNTDTVVYAFDKFVQLIVANNPNIMEMLFQKPDMYTNVSKYGQMILDNRNLFLSRRMFYTFGGYARAQLNRLDNKTMVALPQERQEEHILNSIRNAETTFLQHYMELPDDAIKLYIDKSERDELDSEIFMDVNLHHYPLRDYKGMWNEMHSIVKEYGKLGQRAANAIAHNKVNKHAMHLVRLMNMCIEALETGSFDTYRTKDHDLLMRIRNGEFMADDKTMTREFYEMVDNLEAKMKYTFENTSLPEKPKEKEIDDLLFAIYAEQLKNFS